MQLKGSAYQHSLCIVRAHFYEFSEEKVKRGDREILAQDRLLHRPLTSSKIYGVAAEVILIIKF